MFPGSTIAARRRRCDAGTVLRLLIVDDNPSFLEAASSLLEREGLAVAGVATSAEQAVGQTEALAPDVVLVDVMLGSESGLELAHDLAKLNGGVKVILMSTHSETHLGELLADTPAIGFIPKMRLSAAEVDRLVAGSAE
jgi:two-component system, NarL family, nitrate/nitrite response regulator NarL